MQPDGCKVVKTACKKIIAPSPLSVVFDYNGAQDIRKVRAMETRKSLTIKKYKIMKANNIPNVSDLSRWIDLQLSTIIDGVSCGYTLGNGNTVWIDKGATVFNVSLANEKIANTPANLAKLHALAVNGTPIFYIWLDAVDDAATTSVYLTEDAARADIARLEADDKEDGIYEPDAYSIINAAPYFA